MIIFTIFLSALSLAGLILLVYFTYRMVRDIGAGKSLDSYALKIGMPALVMFLSLILQRLIPLAMGFLIAAILGFVFLLLYAKLGQKQAAPISEPVVTFRLVNLEKYAKHIGEKAIIKRVLRLQSLVDSIRSMVGYNQKTLIDQGADVLRMENIYLPRIESLLGQYIKISTHDRSYDSRGLMEQLDALIKGINKIQADCLARDKMSIDAEANALISAMELDGYGDGKDMQTPNNEG